MFYETEKLSNSVFIMTQIILGEPRNAVIVAVMAKREPTAILGAVILVQYD
jgi:hypothetical protein